MYKKINFFPKKCIGLKVRMVIDHAKLLFKIFFSIKIFKVFNLFKPGKGLTFERIKL